MAGNLGYNTTVVSDATATFDRFKINGEKYSADLIHLTTLVSLKNEFTEVITTQ
ncbi:MAG: isochorismatase family protein [Prolixibacteraceae bacterium]|nr:isochorismatase family protein [Prolixibacteraceae bacterium]